MDISNPSSRGHHVDTPTITYNPSFILHSPFFSLRFLFVCLLLKAYIKPTSFYYCAWETLSSSWHLIMAWNFQSRIYKYFMYKLSVLLWAENQSEIRKISQNISHILISNCTLRIPDFNIYQGNMTKKVDKEMFTRFPLKHKAWLEHTPLIWKWKFPYAQKSKISKVTWGNQNTPTAIRNYIQLKLQLLRILKICKFK